MNSAYDISPDAVVSQTMDHRLDVRRERRPPGRPIVFVIATAMAGSPTDSRHAIPQFGIADAN